VNIGEPEQWHVDHSDACGQRFGEALRGLAGGGLIQCQVGVCRTTGQDEFVGDRNQWTVQLRPGAGECHHGLVRVADREQLRSGLVFEAQRADEAVEAGRQVLDW
jgi:hypothetical protein